MSRILMLFCVLILIEGCQKLDDLPDSGVEPWNPVFAEITEPILDMRADGDQLYVITNDWFYRIQGEQILEKRSLTEDKYPNYSNPIIGPDLIFRLVNYDTVAYLEFSPIKPGGNTMRLSYNSLGDDKLTFPITHANGARHTGRFDDQLHFLFAGIDYPSFQQFVSHLKIDYDRITNTIHQIEIINRTDLHPSLSISGFPYRTEDVLEVDGIFFICLGDGGIYRFEDGVIDYLPGIGLTSIVNREQNFIGAGLYSGLVESDDQGMTWTPLSMDLQNGWNLDKAGDFYIEVSEYNHIFRVGQEIEDLSFFTFPPHETLPFSCAEIKYYEDSYYLYGLIEGKNQIFKRSTLD